MGKLVKSLAFMLLAMTLPVNAEDAKPTETFVVISEYITDDVDLIRNNLADQSGELLKLWQDGIVENAYLNKDDAFESGEDIRTIVFFIKANSEEDARAILSEFTFSKKGIVEYQVHHVGQLWLKAYEDFAKQ